MDYIGAADYYFWKGVKKGLGCSINLVDKVVKDLYIFGNNDVSRACYEAYGWGYCFGTRLTQEQYLDLTVNPVHVTIEEIDKVFDEVANEIRGIC